MALPVNIAGLSTAVAPVGPFQLAAGTYSTIAIETGGTGASSTNFNATTQQAHAQTLTNVASPTTIVAVTVKLAKGGSPTDNIYCEIRSTNAAGTLLATSDNIALSTLTTTLTEATFSFPSPPTISASAVFATVFKRSGAASATDFPILGSTVANIYAGGGTQVYDGSAWSAVGSTSENWVQIKTSITVAADAYYFFGRDGTTATTLRAYKNLATWNYTIATSGTNASLLGSSVANAGASQTFTTAATNTAVNSISFMLRKVGTPTDNLVVQIFAYDTGTSKPTGSPLATTNVIAGSTLTTSSVRYLFTFNSPVALAANTKYAAVVYRSTTAGDAVNYYQILANTSANLDPNQNSGPYNVQTATFGTQSTTDYDLIVNGVTLSTPDVSWASVATKTGFTTAILNLAAWQAGTTVHIGVQDGTASTALATKYVSFDMLTDTFLATTETISAAVAVTGGAGGVRANVSLVVRGNGEVVAFYSGLQTKTSGTFRMRVYYRRRTALNTWSAETQVDSNIAADNNWPFAALGAADRVHFFWNNQLGVAYRTLSAANALNTAGSSGSMGTPGDACSYDRSGTTKVVFISNDTGQSVGRFDSADNPTPVFSNPAPANATLPHRVGVNLDTDEVTIVYRNSADSDLYAIKSTNDGATFDAAVSFFVGTVAEVDTNLSRSSSGSMYQRGSSIVVGYVVNDNGTLKYNEYVIAQLGASGTGTLACDVADVDGVGTVVTPDYGALASDVATVAGAGTARWVGTGSLAAAAATVVGSLPAPATGTGALTAPARTVAGVGSAIFLSTGTGALTCATATQVKNYLLQSEDYGYAYWTKFNSIATSLGDNAPFGGGYAFKIAVDGTTGVSRGIYSQPISPAAGDGTLSFYVKADTATWVQLSADVNSANFNIVDGTVGRVQGSGYTATIKDKGNGWWRCALTGPTPPTAYAGIYILDGDTSWSSGSTAGLSIFLWGAQYDVAPSTGAPPPTYSAEALQFFARVTGLTDTRKDIYNTYINALVSAGVWAKLHWHYKTNAPTPDIAITNLKSASYKGTIYGTPIFAIDGGIAGRVAGGTTPDYIDTGYNPSTQSTQNDAHISVTVLSNAAGQTGPAIGAATSAAYTHIYPKYTNGVLYGRINDAPPGSTGPTNTDASGFIVATRSGASAQKLYDAAVDTSMTSVASGVPANVSMYLLAHNSTGVAEGGTWIVTAGSAGSNLTQAEVTAFKNAQATFDAAVAADRPTNFYPDTYMAMGAGGTNVFTYGAVAFPVAGTFLFSATFPGDTQPISATVGGVSATAINDQVADRYSTIFRCVVSAPGVHAVVITTASTINYCAMSGVMLHNAAATPADWKSNVIISTDVNSAFQAVTVPTGGMGFAFLNRIGTHQSQISNLTWAGCDTPTSDVAGAISEASNLPGTAINHKTGAGTFNPTVSGAGTYSYTWNYTVAWGPA